MNADVDTPTPTTVRLDRDGDRLVVVVVGDLDVTAAHLPYELVSGALEDDPGGQPGGPEVVVDLTEVTFVDSAGLGALIRVQQEAAARGGTTSLRGLQPRYRRLLEMTGLDRDLPSEA